MIVGVDLKKLPGEAGEFFRNREAAREIHRRTQQWFRPADLDLGEVRKGGVAVGRFTLRNPTGKPRVLKSLASSCVCQKLILHVGGRDIEVVKGKSLDLPLAPDATGELEVHVSVNDVGERLGEILVTTDDPQDPVIRLRVKATGIEDFVVRIGGRRENSVWLGSFSTHERKSFEATVESRDGKPFEITGHGPLPAGLALSYEPIGGDRSRWRIEGTAGPGLPEGGWGGTLEFHTDRGAAFTLLVQAVVEPPIVVEPMFLPFGMIPAARGKKGRIVVRAGHPADRFRIAGVTIRDLRLAGKPFDARRLSAGVLPDASPTRAEIELAVPGGLPRGRLEGKLEIRFADGGPAPRTVSFVGFVR